MTNQLTPQILGMYLGSKALVGYPLWPNEYWVEMEITGFGIDYWKQAGCIARPILRPLSSMTREDSIEAYKAATGYEIAPEEEAYSIVWHVLNRFGENGFYLSHTLRISGFIRLINHLRSRGFDCDDLIEQGLAIEK